MQGPLGATDPSRWRLDSSDAGRHNWAYQGGSTTVPLASLPINRDQTPEDRYWLGLPTGAPTLPNADDDPGVAARNGYEFWKLIQSSDGHWAGEYGQRSRERLELKS